MREVLFKAKRMDNGEWVYWNIFGELCRKSGKGTRLAIQNSATISYYDYIHQIRQFISTDTICRCTDLTDKNGNKIWENDIVNGHKKRGAAFFQCVVKYNDRKARFDVEAMGCMFPLCIEEYDEDFFMNGLDYEVIGNTFDNADLLEGE